jgi:hypothetical protein
MEKVSNVDAKEHLLSELKRLRASVKDITESFLLRSESEIETLAGYIAVMSAKESRQINRTWLKELRSSSFKPAKGRLKDLKKIDYLLDDLLNMIIEIQSKPIAAPRIRKHLPKTKLTDPGVDVP